ncbi:MAG: leucine-rich repeat domain-containing protein [Eubacteriales bacterium]|nr:leucine-rich repeat domain-containing protein [Eubacteriales bacterium]MDD3881382.1 leucine-rich repeat domain-containing protein [Eubacteriales bacterium]MDD4513069.1 leucine-rich repeat domain-containing protein [Eubacteriales bacterium]
MKKYLLCLLALMMFILPTAAGAEDSATAAPTATEEPTVSYDGLTVPVSSVTVDFDEAKIKPTDIAKLEKFIEQLPQLELLNMYNTRLTNAQMDELATKFPTLKFGWTLKIGDHAVRTDTTAFSTLHNKSSKYHTAKDFAPLKYCWNIKALDIGHNNISDLSFLSGLTELRILIIACDYIKDISPVANLTKLEYLEIFKNQITDISPLEGLTNLIDLNICFNRIKDYTPLYGLTNLERLWLYNSNTYTDSIPVPSDVIAKLKESLPDTYIDSKSYSTLGGWREHKRYFVLKEIFATSTFMPWDALDNADEQTVSK